MELEVTLSIIGVLITIFIGYIGIKYTLKYRKRTEIRFFSNHSLSLFKTTIKNFDDIEIKFQGNKIDENLILFRGTFLNNGNTDIDKVIIHKPLEIQLPSNYKWTKFNLIDSSDGLNINASIEEEKVAFNWDLFKEGEYFAFDSLVEYISSNTNSKNRTDISEDLVNNLKINHRIRDLRKVQKQNSIPLPISNRQVFFISLLIVLATVGGLNLAYDAFNSQSYTVLHEVRLDSLLNQYVKIEAINDNNGKLILITENGEDLKEIDSKDLERLLTSNIKISVVPKGSGYYIELGIYIVVSILLPILWILIAIINQKEKNLYSKLKNVTKCGPFQ